MCLPFRSFVQVLVFLPLALFFKEPVFGIEGERVALVERSIFGYTCFVLSYYALSYISLSDSSAIAFSAPVFVSIFACILLKEPCGVFQVITIIGTLVGVFLIARPSFLFPSADEMVDVFSIQDRITGVILSVLTCLTMSYTYISMRKLQSTPTCAVIAFFSVFCIIAGSLTMNVSTFISGNAIGVPSSPFVWCMIAVNGVCGVLGQATLVLALKLEEAGLVSLLRTFDIVIAFLYQAGFLDQPIHWTSILGSAIVCSGCVAVALKKYFASKQLT